MPDDDMANGLSFSSERMERAFVSWKGMSIQRFHEALKKAEILCRDVDYHCGHTEWARDGVLLLNAALHICDGKSMDMRMQCYQWRPFLAGLLKEWIQSIEHKYKIFVLLLGHAEERVNENFAVELWSKACSHESSKLFHIRAIHHPTFPKEGFGVPNKFVDEAAAFFKDIREVHPDIFKTAKIQRIKQKVSTIDKSISLSKDDIENINDSINDVNDSTIKMNESLKCINKGIGIINNFIYQTNEVLMSSDVDTTNTRVGIKNINVGIDHIDREMKAIDSFVASINSDTAYFNKITVHISNRARFPYIKYVIENEDESINNGVESYVTAKESIYNGTKRVNDGIECIHRDIEMTNEQEEAIKESIKNFCIYVESFIDDRKHVTERIEGLSTCIENIIEETENIG